MINSIIMVGTRLIRRSKQSVTLMRSVMLRAVELLAQQAAGTGAAAVLLLIWHDDHQLRVFPASSLYLALPDNDYK